MKRGKRFSAIGVLCLVAPLAWGKGEDVFLVRSGNACGFVAIASGTAEVSGSERPPSSVETAATEFVRCVKEISGAEMEVKRIPPDQLQAMLAEARANKQTPLLLGSLALQYLGQFPGEPLHPPKDPSGFIISASPEVIAVAGRSVRGTEIGVHALLEQLGMRWFFPGKLGTVVPSSREVAVKRQQTIESPTFAARQFQLLNADDWVRHQCTGGPYFPGGHGIRLGKGVTVETNPELYALIGGKRKGPQLCLSNPETLKRAVSEARDYFRDNPRAPWFGMGPQDKSGFCECEKCRALDGGDWDPFSGAPSVTDRYIWFFNHVLAELKPDFPDKKIAFYIYHSYMRPPVKVKPDPHIVGAIAPIALCRIHGMNNPVCPERGYLKEIIANWRKLIPEVYERGYWFNLADPGMLFIQIDRLKDEIGYYGKQGIQGFRTECLGNWATQGPSLYISGRLMWNSQADTDALLKDYCDKLFGPAAGPMRDYFSFLSDRLRKTDNHAGGAFDLLQFYPPEVRQRAKEIIAKAEKVAAGTLYGERVAIFVKGFDYNEAFAEMREAELKQDWATAADQLSKMDALREELVKGYDVPMLNAGAAKSYLDRFYRLPVQQGAARVGGGNHLVAALSDEWQFLTDPKGVGESIGYERPDPIGGNWQKIAAYSTTWSDIGLRYYKGLAWYRQDVQIPESVDGKRVFLWFGGVDESARIWVNGKMLGNSPESAFTPFEVDATGALKSGKNSVVLCVANLRVDELGTGGITAPAFFYCPAKGDNAVLENLKPLRETFP